MLYLISIYHTSLYIVDSVLIGLYHAMMHYYGTCHAWLASNKNLYEGFNSNDSICYYNSYICSISHRNLYGTIYL